MLYRRLAGLSSCTPRRAHYSFVPIVVGLGEWSRSSCITSIAFSRFVLIEAGCSVSRECDVVCSVAAHVATHRARSTLGDFCAFKLGFWWLMRFLPWGCLLHKTKKITLGRFFCLEVLILPQSNVSEAIGAGNHQQENSTYMSGLFTPRRQASITSC